jgi:hypothetical protein
MRRGSVARSAVDAGGEGSDVVNPGRKRTEIVDAGLVDQFADLL